MAEADLETQFRSAVAAALGGSQQARDEATNWLQALRTSHEGANVCFSVLGSDLSNPAERLFAAQTLRQLCRKARSLEQTLVGQLAEALVWAEDSRRTEISNQLSAALSTSLLKVEGAQFETILDELKAWVDNTMAPPAGAMLLVVALTQLPELVKEQGFTHAQNREHTQAQLAGGGLVVLRLFDEVVSAAERLPAEASQHMVTVVLRAAIVWIDCLRDVCPLDNWLSSQMMTAAVKISTISISALRLSAVVLGVLASAYLSPDLVDLALKTIMDSTDSVLATAVDDHQAIEAAAQVVEVIAEVAVPCLRICSKMDSLTDPWTRSFTRLLELGQQHGGQALAVSLQVWQGLCDVTRRHETPPAMKHTSHEVLRHVINVGVHGTMYPIPYSPNPVAWSEQDEEDFETLRNDVREVVREIVQPQSKRDQDARAHVLHCVQLAHDQLQNWYHQVSDENLGGWQAAESWLHMCTAVAKSIITFAEHEDQQLLDMLIPLIRLFLAAPAHVRPIVRSCAMLLGVLAPVVAQTQDSNMLVDCIGFALQTAYCSEDGVSLRTRPQPDLLAHLTLGSYVSMRAKQDHVAGVSLIKLTQNCEFLLVEIPTRTADAWNLVRLVDQSLLSLEPVSLTSLTVVQALYVTFFDLLCKHRKTGCMPLKSVMLLQHALTNVLQAVTMSTYVMAIAPQILYPILAACSLQVDLARQQLGQPTTTQITSTVVDSMNLVLQTNCGCNVDFSQIATMVSSEHTVHECIDILATTVRLLAKEQLNELIAVSCPDHGDAFDHTIGTAMGSILEYCCLADDQDAANLMFSTIRSYLTTRSTNPSTSQRQLALAENFAHCAAKLLHDIPFCHHAINLFDLVVKLIGSHACAGASNEVQFVASVSQGAMTSSEQFCTVLLSVLAEVFDPAVATLHRYLGEKSAGAEATPHTRCAHAILGLWISATEIAFQLTTALGLSGQGLQILGAEQLLTMVDTVTACLHSGTGDRAFGESLLRFSRLCYKQTSHAVPADIHAFVLNLLVDGGRAAQLVGSILTAISHSMPAWLLDDLVFTLKTVHQAIGQEHMAMAVTAALNDPHCSRFHVSDAGKEKFVLDLVGAADKIDWKGYKNIVKKFCGGKKKGAHDKPRA